MATGSASPEPSAGTERGRARLEYVAVRPPQRPPSLRRRLAATFAALVLVVAIGQAFALYWTTEHAEEALIDRVLEEQLRRSVAAYRADAEAVPPARRAVRLFADELGGHHQPRIAPPRDPAEHQA